MANFIKSQISLSYFYELYPIHLNVCPMAYGLGMSLLQGNILISCLYWGAMWLKNSACPLNILYTIVSHLCSF